MARRDTCEHVHPEGGFGPQLRFDSFGFAQEVFLDELVDLVDVLREQDRLAILVVLRAPGASAHLLDLEDRDWRQSEVHVAAVQVADDDPPRGEVYSRGIVNDKAKRARIALIAVNMQVEDRA